MLMAATPFSSSLSEEPPNAPAPLLLCINEAIVATVHDSCWFPTSPACCNISSTPRDTQVFLEVPKGVSCGLGSLSTQAPLSSPCVGVPSGYRHPSRSSSLPSHVSAAQFQSISPAALKGPPHPHPRLSVQDLTSEHGKYPVPSAGAMVQPWVCGLAVLVWADQRDEAPRTSLASTVNWSQL